MITLFTRVFFRVGAWLILIVAAAAALAAETADSTDTGWPRSFASGDNQIELFQPQVESWQTNSLRSRAVVQVTFPFDSTPRLGVVWFTASTQVDKAKRLVTLQNLRIDRVKFSTAANEEANLVQVLSQAMPQGPRTIALDRLLVASVVAKAQAKPPGSLKNDPPIVLWTTNAVAALVLIDGNPVLRPVQGSSLMRVINTASLIVFDPSGGFYYLQGNGQWFQAQGIAGPWQVTSNPPTAVAALAPAVPPAPEPGEGDPVVFVSTHPAELLQTSGMPSYKSEDASGLMYLANSDSQVLYNPLGGTVYLLLSGRWFSAPSLGGPWTYVPQKALPSSFSQIDPAGPKGMVLSSVAGTPQAAAARVANSVPKVTSIQRQGASLEVPYDGDPRFQPIAGTSLQYAVNSSDPVILCQNNYYAVANAVWFVAGAPTGPWALASSVPDAIYQIPPSSPLYYVTFVYVGYTDDEQVECAYTAGYTGSYDSDEEGVPVYGTGYYSDPWVGSYYYGWAWTYGYGYQYRWWESGWLWRPAWNRVGNLYALNRANVYDAWPRTASGLAIASRTGNDLSLGRGYPSTYGRFVGATRAAPMALPASASLFNPYLTAPRARSAADEAKGAEVQMRSVRVGSAASRDYYATTDGNVYWRRDGSWYRADGTGGWGYVSPATGPRTTAYHPQTVATYDRPAAYRPAAPVAEARPPAEARSLDYDYYARAAGERQYQGWQGGYGGFRGRR